MVEVTPSQQALRLTRHEKLVYFDCIAGLVDMRNNLGMLSRIQVRAGSVWRCRRAPILPCIHRRTSQSRHAEGRSAGCACGDDAVVRRLPGRLFPARTLITRSSSINSALPSQIACCPTSKASFLSRISPPAGPFPSPASRLSSSCACCRRSGTHYSPVGAWSRGSTRGAGRYEPPRLYALLFLSRNRGAPSPRYTPLCSGQAR